MEFSTEILWKILWKSAKLCGKHVDMWKTAFHPRAACLTRKEVTRTNERIKKLRKALDLTQAEFASRIGTSANVLRACLKSFDKRETVIDNRGKRVGDEENASISE